MTSQIGSFPLPEDSLQSEAPEATTVIRGGARAQRVLTRASKIEAEWSDRSGLPAGPNGESFGAMSMCYRAQLRAAAKELGIRAISSLLTTSSSCRSKGRSPLAEVSFEIESQT